MNYKDYLDIKPEVAQALAEGKPVVALESTILSHGMPYPQNLEFAAKVEEGPSSTAASRSACPRRIWKLCARRKTSVR